MELLCPDCGKVRIVKSKWTKYGEFNRRCKVCALKFRGTEPPNLKKQAYNKQYRETHKEELKQYDKNHVREEREKVIQHYGGKCACCGENRYEFLAVDHIDGGGNIHRKSLGIPRRAGDPGKGGGSHFTHWLIANDYPSGFRILCHNCNMSLGLYGYCPHNPELH